MTASGRFVSHFSAQGPGEPTLVVTDLTNTTGTTVDGQHTNFHFLAHLTITPDGEATVDFERASCVP